MPRGAHYTHFPLIHKLAHSSPEGKSIAKIKTEQTDRPSSSASRAGPVAAIAGGHSHPVGHGCSRSFYTMRPRTPTCLVPVTCGTSWTRSLGLNLTPAPPL